jgi:hypothetical protein
VFHWSNRFLGFIFEDCDVTAGAGRQSAGGKPERAQAHLATKRSTGFAQNATTLTLTASLIDV